jgi:hypothetical protein
MEGYGLHPLASTRHVSRMEAAGVLLVSVKKAKPWMKCRKTLGQLAFRNRIPQKSSIDLTTPKKASLSNTTGTSLRRNFWPANPGRPYCKR